MVDRKYEHRIVHFDFKGAIPRISFLEKVISLISSWGTTGVLIEYEDSFPYHGDLAVLRAPMAFTLNQVSDIHEICKRNNIEIIPLIQTFGHMEFVLKHDVFRHLREVDLYPNALCPFQPDAVNFTISIIVQIMELHSESNYLHIGADEVWHLGQCERCLREMELRKWSPSDLYLFWVSKIARLTKEKYPNIKVIVWDDMMRPIPVTKLKDYKIGEVVEPMIWKYDAKDFNFEPGMFERFCEVFDCIWTASCYKGASGSTQFLPPIQHHIDNQLTWIAVIEQQRSKFKTIRGIVLTGWQRYDHYAVLCELLPVAIPSLALCLKVLQKESFLQDDHETVSRELGFQTRINVYPFPRPQILEQGMTFPGWKIYLAVQMWSNFLYRYQIICNSEAMLGWFSDYFRSKNFTNPAQVETILFQVQELEGNLLEMEGHMKNSLLEVYHEDTWEEWMGCFFKPLCQRIRNVAGDCKKQIEVGGRVRNWNPDKRPNVDQSADLESMVNEVCSMESDGS